jgi:FkbM family methyltransferase
VIAVKKSILSSSAALGAKLISNNRLQVMLFNALRLDRVEIRDITSCEDIKFLSYCLARRDRSRSQILQDLWVSYELDEKINGFFVEFGATNGVKNSNTWLLEKQFSWTGILAEPNPLWHSELMLNRDAFIETKCVSSNSGDFVTFIATNNTDPELSGLAEFSDADHFGEKRSRGERMELETISLDDLLDKYDAPPIIDYLSVDTEGSELEILTSYSFRHQFRAISVENNPKNEVAVDNLLLSKGYMRVFRKFSQWDSWYVPAESRNKNRPQIFAPEA